MPLYFLYTMVQKSQKWPKTQIKGGGGDPALNVKLGMKWKELHWESSQDLGVIMNEVLTLSTETPKITRAWPTWDAFDDIQHLVCFLVQQDGKVPITNKLSHIEKHAINMTKE